MESAANESVRGDVHQLPLSEADRIFLDLMRSCRNKRVSLDIASGSPYQARVAVQMLLEASERRVCIFSRRLRSDIFGYHAIVNAALSFLNSRVEPRLDILVKEPVLELREHPLLDALQQIGAFGTVAHLHVANNPIIHSCTSNFIVSDDTAYRLSKDESVETAKDGVWAVTNFNDVQTAQQLLGMFQRFVGCGSTDHV